VIRNFRHKGLKLLYTTGKTSGIVAIHAKRILVRLDRLNRLSALEGLPPEWDCHPLHGDREGYYAISINAQWRLVFRFEDGEFCDLDYVQYH
jgi:proteic killer suppression protein